MTYTIASSYRAELLFCPDPAAVPFRIAVNGGCDLARKCRGAADYVAEGIQMVLPSGGAVSASWTPRKGRKGDTFVAAFAGYEEPGKNFIRFDNAHDRDVLHVDIRYRGRVSRHDGPISLPGFEMMNRRRIALIRLMCTLEQEIDWHVPVWLYMPGCAWWEDWNELPEVLRSWKPSGFTMTSVCEAILAYMCLNPRCSNLFLGATVPPKVTMDAINEAMDYLASSYARFGDVEFSRVILGRLTVMPFPMYAPPGAKLEGPSDLLNPFFAT